MLGKKMTHEEYVEKVNERQGDLYEVTSTYLGSNKPISARCKVHGEFTKNEARALLMYRCPECGKEVQKSLCKKKENGVLYEPQMNGKASEFYVAYDLSQLGYEVVMVTGNPRYDLILESDKGRLFVQVKSTYKKEKEIKVNLRGNSNTRRYNSKEVDIKAIHERSENKVIYIPINEVEGKSSISMRYEKSIYSQHNRSKLVSDYLTLKDEWFVG